MLKMDNDHHKLLMSRIEDQMLEKFNIKYPDNEFIKSKNPDYLDREEMFNLLTEWIDFWLSEKPIIKKEATVLIMKSEVCDTRINLLLKQARDWDMEKDVRLYFIDLL